jgi:alkylation response protein AidB-like acyl-CoA dehydrogenase
VPIGNFQALQHKAVEMEVALEQARSMACYGAMMLTSPAAERSAALSRVKIQIGRSARFIGQQAIQLHGGIGMTAEYQASHYFKRLTVIEQSFGDIDHHMAQLMRLDSL